jgi:hypothetical protein
MSVYNYLEELPEDKEDLLNLLKLNAVPYYCQPSELLKSNLFVKNPFTGEYCELSMICRTANRDYPLLWGWSSISKGRVTAYGDDIDKALTHFEKECLTP